MQEYDSNMQNKIKENLTAALIYSKHEFYFETCKCKSERNKHILLLWGIGLLKGFGLVYVLPKQAQKVLVLDVVIKI